MLVSLRDVEEGIEHARTTADQHALDLANTEHKRLILPLRAKTATPDSSSDATRAGIRDTARTLKEYEERLNSLEAQKRSTAAAIVVAKRNHNTYISQICAHSRQPPPVPATQQPPASANPATVVAPAAQQPPASPNPRLLSLPLHSRPWLRPTLQLLSLPLPSCPRLEPISQLLSPPLPSRPWLRPTSRLLSFPLRRSLWVPPFLPRLGPRPPLPRLSLFQLGPTCRCRPPENTWPPQHPSRSWSRVPTGSSLTNHLPPPTTIPTWSSASPN